MAELTPQQKRRQTLLDKYGSEEALKEHYRQMQIESRKTYKGTGGLHKASKERRQEISRMGNKAKWGH